MRKGLVRKAGVRSFFSATRKSQEGKKTMTVKRVFLYLTAGWIGFFVFAACAATAVTFSTGDTDALIDTRLNFGEYAGVSDALVDTRINFVVRSPEPGAKIDTMSAPGTMIILQ